MVYTYEHHQPRQPPGTRPASHARGAAMLNPPVSINAPASTRSATALTTV
jgi:hypothetical protein